MELETEGHRRNNRELRSSERINNSERGGGNKTRESSNMQTGLNNFLLFGSAKCSVFFTFFIFLLAGAFFSARLDFSHAIPQALLSSSRRASHVYGNKLEFPLNCTGRYHSKTCPRNYPTNYTKYYDPSPQPTCPDYFRWIHEDLRPWAKTGITRAMVARASKTANFKLVIVNGTAYVEKFKRAFQTRDVFTVWGILQLLRLYPGQIPDLVLMFDCVDWPVIKSIDYTGPNALTPPPLFRYCSDDDSLDIVFPDWSFWGWAEVNIKPWESIVEDLKEGNRRKTWMEREPYAYWKGNPEVAETRKNLMTCNVSETHDWNARLFVQDWGRESQVGFKDSDLASQCHYRYKIYIEGSAWSVSEKYILACDSTTLLVKPHYYDFFSRSLVPFKHYWPIKEDDKCRSIKYAVDWGNRHTLKAQHIGKNASAFIQDDLKMKNVYDYMLHLLNAYAKLQRFKPKIPKNAIEMCSDNMACRATGLEKKFMMQSLVKGPADTPPCTMPPPYDPQSLLAVLSKKEKTIKQVESLEKKYWDIQNNLQS